MAWTEGRRTLRGCAPARIAGAVALALGFVALPLAGAAPSTAAAAAAGPPAQIGISACGAAPPRSAQLWSDADAVFAVDLASLEEATSSATESGSFNPVVQLQVSEVYKGSVPATVTLRADPCNVAVGVGTVEGDPIVAARRTTDGSYVLGGLLTKAQADAFGGTLPAASGSGPVGAIAAIDGGPFDLVAVDRAGAPVGFRAGTHPPAALALCPGAATAVAFEGGAGESRQAWLLSTIDVATMTTRGRRAWPADRRPTVLSCTERDGSSVDAFVPARGAGSDPTDLSTGPTITLPGVAPSTPPDDPGDPADEGPAGPAETVPDSANAGSAPGSTGSTGSTDGTRPSIVHVGPTTSAEVPAALGPAVGVDAQHRFLAWADPQASKLAAIDPATGSSVATFALPGNDRGTALGVSPDGTLAVVAAVDPTRTVPAGTGAVGGTGALGGGAVTPDVSTPFVDETPIDLVLVDLTGAAPAKVLASRTGVEAGRLGVVDGEVVAVWTGASAANDGQLTTERFGLDGTLIDTSTTPAPTVVPGAGGLLGSPSAASAAPLVPPGLAVDPLGHSGRAVDPRLGAQTPRLFGTAVDVVAFTPAGAQVTVDAQAAKPSIASTPRPNGGAPVSTDRTLQDRLTVVMAVVAVGLLVLLLAGMYRHRPAPRA